MFDAYVKHGWALCRINPGGKGPRNAGWNLRENAVTDASTLVGAGLMHAYSGTCAIDIDDYPRAEKFLQEHGISLSLLSSAPDAVQIRSGRPNRAKLIYKLEAPLASLALAKENGKAALEFRCGTKKGTTVQDVLPPTTHPDTGKPYEWAGDWKHLPTLPAALKALWSNLLVSEERESPIVKSTSADLDELRDLLSRRDPNCGYDDWIKIGMAIHHESGGSNEGLGLWDEFSAPGTSYPGLVVLQAHWVSFGRSNTPVTADSLRRSDVAAVGEFEDLTASADWLDLSGSVPDAAATDSPAYRFLSLDELFERPEPTWIIPGVLPEAGIGSFWGQPGGGKTFLAVDTVLDVALGHPWRGLPVKQGPAAYIAAEDDSGVQARLKAGLAARGATAAPIRVLPTAPVFTNPKQAEALLKAIRGLGKLALVVVDTLAAVTPGADENTGKDMGQLIHLCQKIHDLTGGLVLLVHHEGKAAGKGPRGWSGLHGAFEVEWEVTDEEDYREMRITKMKNAPSGLSYKFQLLPVGSSCIVEWL